MVPRAGSQRLMDELYDRRPRHPADRHPCLPPLSARPARPRPAAPLPHTWRPMGVRFAVIGFGLMLLVVCAAAWFGFDDETRAKFNILQRLTLLADGRRVRRHRLGPGARPGHRRAGVARGGQRLPPPRLEWEQVLGVHLPSGAPWATLDLADGTTISAMAFQGSDGRTARTAYASCVR